MASNSVCSENRCRLGPRYWRRKYSVYDLARLPLQNPVNAACRIRSSSDKSPRNPPAAMISLIGNLLPIATATIKISLEANCDFTARFHPSDAAKPTIFDASSTAEQSAHYVVSPTIQYSAAMSHDFIGWPTAPQPCTRPDSTFATLSCRLLCGRVPGPWTRQTKKRSTKNGNMRQRCESQSQS